ncbi:MAG: hypothetical protein P1S60_18360 [Anaerolineae bacterium]|nr:hypothetical protein [Anaerolineae bacterium]
MPRIFWDAGHHVIPPKFRTNVFRSPALSQLAGQAFVLDAQPGQFAAVTGEPEILY